MKRKQLWFSYEEQQVLTDNGLNEALCKACLLLEEEKLTRKDLHFIWDLHKKAKALLAKKINKNDDENEI